MAPWLLFCLILLWGWRVGNIYRDVPGYGDALEVLWGIQWYNDALFEEHTSPFFTQLTFHPHGWRTATLAHTPIFFVLLVPLYRVGGLAFAYNCAAILSFFVAFAGAHRFAALFVRKSLATCAALAFTFVGMRWFRVYGHLHMLWASSLLPWLTWSLERARRRPLEQASLKPVYLCGLIWGVMINVSLYSVFFGGGNPRDVG